MTPPDGVVLRPARTDDLPAITGLVSDLGYSSTEDRVGVRLAAALSDPAQELIVADRAGRAIGIAVLHRLAVLNHDGPSLRLSLLVVRAAEQGRGIGRLLVEAAEARAREIGAGSVHLTSGNHRAGAAHAFYRALGYAGDGVRFRKKLE